MSSGPRTVSGTSVAAPGPARRPSPPAARPSAIRRLGRYLFPVETNEPPTESGFAEDRPWGWVYALFALAIGVGLAAYWWWSTLTMPVPPGDDPSTWLTTAYPYVGLAYPTGVSLLGYPPASFPFIGLSIIAGGGPLTGGRIFTSGIIVALGVSTYYFGRTLLRRPSLALLAEGLLLAEPDFQQIFYFGGYPNLFAMVFLTLSLVFLVMFLHNRRSSYIFLFWVSVTVCVLAHSLTAAVLAGTLALLALGLMMVGRLPRRILLSRGGIAGVVVAIVGIGGYYGLTHFLAISHPVYLASTTNISGVSSILLPFHFGTVSHALAGTTITLSSTGTLEILTILTGVLLATALVLRLLAPAWLTTPWLVVTASILGVFIEVLVGANRGIATDYRRFPYFLYQPFIVGLLLGVEAAIDRWWPLARGEASASVRGARRPRPRMARLRRRWGEPVLVGVAVVVVLASASFYTVPASTNYMSYYTLYAHDPAFVATVNALIDSGIPGNILSTSPYSGHWPSTLSSRLTYVPAPVGSVSADFSPPEILNEELSELTLANRYLATNSLIGVGVPGLAAADFNGTPIYGAFSNASYQEILRVPPASLEFGLVNGTVVVPFNVGVAAPAVLPVNGGTGYEIVYQGYGATMIETVSTVPGVPTANVNLTVAMSSPTASPLTFVQARIGVVTGVGSRVLAGPTPGSFVWNVSTKTGGFTTFGNASPASALSKLLPFNVTTGTNPALVFRTNASNVVTGASSLSLAFTLTTPVATNVLENVGPWLSSDQTWSNWSLRFILQFNGSASLSLITPGYLQAEYGAALYAAGGSWRLYLLPQWPVTPPVPS